MLLFTYLPTSKEVNISILTSIKEEMDVLKINGDDDVQNIQLGLPESSRGSFDCKIHPSDSTYDRIQDRSLRPQCRPRSRSDLPQPHLQSCPGSRRQGSPAVCCAGRPDCASDQDSSLRA